MDAIGKAPAFTDKFGGKLIGKGKKADRDDLYPPAAGKQVKVEVKNSDPMRFESLALAMGPAQSYPRTVVNGNLDYDYETGNYYTNGIRFIYQLNGKEMEDVVTGSIKWVEDANRATNGKGQYEFNLRWNEAKKPSRRREADAFAKMSDEEAFFAVDNTVPSLTGTITYEDPMTTVGDKPAARNEQGQIRPQRQPAHQGADHELLQALAGLRRADERRVSPSPSFR